MSLLRRSSSNFYGALYTKFDDKYKSFSELPGQWKNEKDLIASFLKSRISKGQVLSFGSGLCYIEKVIANNNDKISLDCFDFSEKSFTLISREKFQNIQFYVNELPQKDYDSIFCIQLLYALDDTEIIDLLTHLRQYLCEDGTLIICDTSFYASENGIRTNLALKFVRLLKTFIMYIFIFSFGRHRFQFDGWHRCNSHVKNIFKSAKFKHLENVIVGNQSLNIFKVDD